MADEVRSYRDLKVWQKGMDLATECYARANVLPKEEQFGLVSQIRRAAVSVPANIAEGYGRESRGEFIQFLRVAQGSLKELETHIMLVERVYPKVNIMSADLLQRADELGRMLRALIRTLQSKPKAVTTR